MRALVLALAMALTAPIAFAAPAAAENYDGRWVAEMPPQSAPCNWTAVMRVMVMGNMVMGQVISHSSPFNGTIDANGSGNFSFGHDTGTIKFTGDRFDADWVTPKCGHLHASGDREASDAMKAQMATERKQRQVQFAALTEDALAGRPVDYTALRAAYPYTETWDPYDNKAQALLTQAHAAQKGGDCVDAMDKLAMAIHQDFTMDSAHALRADCTTGAAAATENAIANGLIHALMDSGDGESEKTAYRIVTQREEMDVLANRHLVLARRTAVRGSDGHFYERIDAIAAKAGAQGAAQSMAKSVTLYFDVSAFTAGRLSRDAMLTTLAATIH